MSAMGRIRRFRSGVPATADLGRQVTVNLTHYPTLPPVDAVASDSRPNHCAPAIPGHDPSPPRGGAGDLPLAAMTTALVFFPRK